MRRSLPGARDTRRGALAGPPCSAQVWGEVEWGMPVVKRVCVCMLYMLQYIVCMHPFTRATRDG